MSNEDFVASIQKATMQIIAETTINMNKACLIVERQAKQDCPVDQGALRASITHDVIVDASGIIGVIGSNLEYAPYVHNGTGIYAINGDGRKTPWGYMSKSGKYKGFHITRGQKATPFLEYAKLFNMDKVAKTLGGK